MKKPLIKKLNGRWMVIGRYGFWGHAMAWCHARNIAEGNYR